MFFCDFRLTFCGICFAFESTLTFGQNGTRLAPRSDKTWALSSTSNVTWSSFTSTTPPFWMFFSLKGKATSSKGAFFFVCKTKLHFLKESTSKLVWWYFEWIFSAAQNDGWLCAQLSWVPHIVEEIWHLMWPLSCNAFLFKTHSHTINTSWP